jgi:ribosomal protein L11 methyltransferase
VLAIAAARLLRTQVIAGDIDPVATRAAHNNARLNRAASMVVFSRAHGTRVPAVFAHAPYQLIFANILLGPLVRLAVPLRSLAAPGAYVVLSGLLPSHANAVLAIYRAQGFTLERRITLEGWLTLVMRRPFRH